MLLFFAFNFSIRLKYSFPDEMFPELFPFSDSSREISSAFRNSYLYSFRNDFANVVFPLPFGPAIISNSFLLTQFFNVCQLTHLPIHPHHYSCQKYIDDGKRYHYFPSQTHQLIVTETRYRPAHPHEEEDEEEYFSKEE